MPSTNIIDFIPTLGWGVEGLDFSPIRGPEGNIEFLLDLLPTENLTKKLAESAISDTIDAAYDKFLKSSDQPL